MLLLCLSIVVSIVVIPPFGWASLSLQTRPIFGQWEPPDGANILRSLPSSSFPTNALSDRGSAPPTSSRLGLSRRPRACPAASGEIRLFREHCA
ncbi:hypothetical protein F5148DRAFT_582595 [Russula earlei]|uniref:Uncharacterized protein n=1 Tax=Russula earlei TaxID=71964 RepID=A0ACC0UFG7_9AGAM|nr:hypothetical protein F5148DRAFT_582595 [Russula earlei]